ncbi:syndecan-3 [Pygocentrus nattereri]|uniref:syndecan-3 n=1 Tax=Pygocentrus nattereri TaxID=42514 RepID=UPI0008146442|nr:syndecan-3 [Pygocentrus nattereri]
MKLPCWMALALLLAHSVATQRSSSRPVDEESSGDDFYDDEDLFSGSGSGYPEVEVSPTEKGVSFTTEEPLPLSTTQATGPAPSAPPAAEPSSTPPPETERESGVEWEREIEKERELEMELERKREQEEMKRRERERVRERERERERERVRTRTTIEPWYPTVPVVITESPVTLGDTEDLSTAEEEEDLFITTETSPPYDPFSTDETLTDDITTTEVLPITVASTTAQPTTSPTTPSTAPVRPRKPQTTPSRARPTESSARPMLTSTVQVRSPESTVNNEVAAAGPSGDSEIREDEGRQGNEVGRGKGVTDTGVEPDLTGNTIDTGSSAAQLPQKNILERKEVLIAVIVGGVVGALFAAFLVMLLVYRMKKKDEGSYTLEEPKQATVTYQKPDKQEEFYA